MNYQDLTDVELLALMKDDDEKAFEEIYSRFHDFLYTYAFKLTGEENETSDILQVLFVNLWTKRHHLEISGKLVNYLHQGIKYGFLNEERRRATLSKYQESLKQYLSEGYTHTEEQLFEKELVNRLRKIAEEIPGKGGQIFLMTYFDNLSVSEVAETLGISEKTVRNLQSKATKDVRLKSGLSIALFFLSTGL
ncbi:RNA polymerase sigma factor [Pedobacter nyackensis]|uniref:RNA polymerase sigma-70 factor, ECF subfamily n=1 Tax=Pedobacter nyackensis TaxID=475255 RepID=A0A1W2ANH2_9SPHI|nr:sigma-70 family RNA polymerase sigma factor [Pedobacter nyackensis]SMC62246.1 RNA polymerase sigma-70 factor, ECF subfamily [Pedobacter nyackensis]